MANTEEARIHALIHSKIPSFLPAGNIDYMTSREDWSEVNPGYKPIITPELIAKFHDKDEAMEGFLARKSGAIGQWIESEFCTVNRDGLEETLEAWDDGDFAPQSEQVIAMAAFAAIQLQAAYPEASFHVMEGTDAWNNRVCLSVFIPEDVANKGEIRSALHQAKLPKLDGGIVKQVFGDAYDEVSRYFAVDTPKLKL